MESLEVRLAKTFKMVPLERLESALYLYTFKEDVKQEARKMYVKTALLHPIEENELKGVIQDQIKKFAIRTDTAEGKKLLVRYLKMQESYTKLSSQIKDKRIVLNNKKRG